MKIEIDQSGKIEQTSELTVIAFSNGKSATIMISASEIQKKFRKIGKSEDVDRCYVSLPVI